MKPEEIEYIKHRISKAQGTLEEAKYLLSGGFTGGVANRIYYACFYAVSALLLTEGHSSSKHSGIMSLFDRYWVKTGRISAEMGAFYHLMFKQRQKGDYEDLISFEPTDLEAWLSEAEQFIYTITSQIGEIRS